MKVAVTVKPEQIQFEERNIPEINNDQLLLKMKYVGVCGSDIHIYYGKHPFVGPEYYPLVQGHEGVAEVSKVGKNVTGFESGDLVTVMPQLFCGKCEMCRKGMPHICETLKVLGCQCDGLFAEYFGVDANLAIKLPSNADPVESALIEPLAVAIGAVRKLGCLGGKKLLVYGAGVIGNLCAQVAKAFGCAQVTIADIDESRLNTAVVSCGIDANININNPPNGEKSFDDYDYVIECVGIESTLKTAIKHSKKNSKILVVGVFGKEATLPVALIQDRELMLQGSLMYEREDYITAINLLQSHKVIVKPLIYKVLPFSAYDTAYDLIAKNKAKAIKVIIQIC